MTHSDIINDEEVFSWIQEKLRAWGKISRTTRLGEDLGMDGDDAYEFLLEFSEKHQVCMDEFVFDKHFGPEAAANPLTLIRWLFSMEKQFLPVTVDHLCRCAVARRWLPVETL
jgi:hypothetical protein